MKKIFTFVAALMVATMTFAEVSYEYNGGWANEDGWQNKQDMYEALNAFWVTYANVPETYGYYTWTPIDSCAGDVAKGIPTASNLNSEGIGYRLDGVMFEAEDVKNKFGWLMDYMIYVCTLQKTETNLKEAGQHAFLRYNLQAFFMNSQRTSWPVSADYADQGKVDYFQPYWKNGFVNPTSVTEPYALQKPYKEEIIDGLTVKYTFDGWYASADFAGEKIDTLLPTTTGTLYAKWVEYIPSVKEVIAMEDGAETKISAITTYIDGTMAYLQDESAGMRVVFPEGTELKDNVRYVVKGIKSVVDGAPTLTVSVIEKSFAVEAIKPIVVEAVKSLGDYVGTLIQLDGKRIAGYDAAGDPLFRDDHDTIASYKLPIDQATFTVRRKSDVVAVVEQANGLRLRAYVANVKPSAPAGKDSYNYASMTIDDVTYGLTNDWLFSIVLENFNSNKPNDVASGSRSVVLYNGYLYFPNRDQNTPTYLNFKKVNVADGDMFDAIPAADYLFRSKGKAGNAYVFGPANDLKVDNAGNMIASNLITSAKGEFQVWLMTDIDKGEGRLLICDTTLNDDYADNTTLRIDAVGVYGDVTKDAIIMAAASSTSDVYYWMIEDGEWDGNHEWIPTEGGYNWGTAPQCFPIENDMFYVDGFSTYPVLFNMDGEVMDFFDTEDEACLALLTNRNGNTRATGHNGLAEFELGGEYFLLMAGGNTANSPASTFVLYKCADENRVFAEMTQMWEFPYDGMGNVSNDVRTAVPYVLKVDDNTVKFCVYTNNNGYGVYTFTNNAVPSAVENTTNATVGVEKHVVDGQLYIIRNGVRYSVMGSVVK